MPQPSRIRFRIAQEELGSGRLSTVMPIVDDVPLVELARRQEVRPSATATGTGT